MGAVMTSPVISLMWALQLIGLALLAGAWFADVQTAAWIGFAAVCISIGISIAILFLGVGLIGSPSPSGES